LRIGTSGFSYDDWVGPVYPTGTKKADMLSAYAQMFGCVEINSTYYAIPSQSSFASMVRRTPDDFRFAVKANKEMTHTQTPSDATFAAFRSCLQPMADSGKLGCVLAQFPWSFKLSKENTSQLRRFRELTEGLRVVVEFRNSEWVDDPRTFEFLRSLDLGFCCVDEPAIEGLVPPVVEATSGTAYVRFHGRNAAKWWHHDQAHERYDYLYSQDELSDWVGNVEGLAKKSDELYVFFNNHYKGKSVQNARMFARQLGLEDAPGA